MGSEILSLIENAAVLYPHNIAIGDNEADIDYTELMSMVNSNATTLINNQFARKPIAILMKRTRFTPVAMLAVAFSGNFYVVLDCDSPVERLNKIIEALNPTAIIFEPSTQKLMEELSTKAIGIEFNKIADHRLDNKLVKQARDGILECDAIFSIFTSGSTGQPKGALLTHRNVSSYIKWFTNCFNITEKNVFGSQTPMYFSMSVSDMYSALTTGASYQLIPKEYFTFPVKLVDFMNKKQVNTIYWVPSAYGIASKFNLFNYVKLDYLKRALFAGEVMPVKYLNYWKNYYPDIEFANLFGPTETTDICAYYKVDREFKDNENLPIGIACENCRLLLINEEGNESIDGQPGELYVMSEAVAAGYYNNKKKTEEAFVQNPLNKVYPQIVYKTGDIVKKNMFGELEYIGRKDFQIKHMGYRIEPGEIETVLNCTDGVEITVCIYDEKKDQLVLAYEGDECASALLKQKSEKELPVYMVPERFVRIECMPKNMNGKIDRKAIKRIVMNL